MASEWRRRTIGELSINLDAIRVPIRESERHPGPYPYYGASGVVDHVDGFLFDGEYLLVAEDGENLKSKKLPIAFLAQGKFWVNNHAHILKGGPEADTRFLCYALQATNIEGFLSGSTMPKLTQGNLNRIAIPAPSLAEQREIAGVISSFDERIERLRANNYSLEAIARTIFKSWFVDFDPVRAKAEGREPEGMDSATAALFPSEFQQSELGSIPFGWRSKRAGELMELSRESINPLRNPNELFAHYSLPAFDEGKRPKIERGRAIRSNKTIVPFGSILLSKLNPHIPRVWLPNLNMQVNCVCSTEFLVFKPRTGFSVEYLFCQFTEQGFTQKYGGLTTGTSNSHQRVKAEYLLEEKLIAPDSAVVKAFTSLTYPLFEKINNNIETQQTLAELRDTLLPRLISGKLRVPEAEELLEAVL